MLKRPTISTYLVTLNMILIGLLFPSFSFLFLREIVHLRDLQLERNISAIRQSLVTRSSSMMRGIALSAKEAVAGYDFSFLQNLLREVSRADPEIRSCLVVDRNLTIVAHHDPAQVGNRLPGPENAWTIALLSGALPEKQPAPEPEVNLQWPDPGSGREGALMIAAYPIYSGMRLWGLIRCGYSLENIDREIDQAKSEWARQLNQARRYFVFLMAVFMVLGFLIAILLTRSFVRVTHALRAGVQQVANGDLERPITLRGIVCEEFASLVSAFNVMTERLRLSLRQLDEYSKSLEEKVLARTRDLQEAQKIMVAQAHEAGLAEMAVGVLHNIGNAMTPAQVTASVLAGQLAASPLRTRLESSFQPMWELLASGRDLSAGERARLAAILQHLPASLTEEFDRVIAELREIQDKHHHIETIIKLQMRYARLMENPEPIDLNRLARDAVNILVDAMAKRQITVTFAFSPIPMVKAEEAKILQVMVNLIKNAYEAMDGPGECREMTIATGVRDEAEPMVWFSVRDTGCGFSEEIRRQLFTFGYSTKERGTGFGLHSCANTVIANHGRIEAESLGLGLGSTFTILFPAVPQDAPPANEPGSVRMEEDRGA